MPTYSYACTECDNRFDVQQSFDENSLSECPTCTGRLRKLFGNVGVVFKGPGFYRTDARASALRKSKRKSGRRSSSETSSAGTTTPSTSGSEGSKASGSATQSSTGTGSTSVAASA